MTDISYITSWLEPLQKMIGEINERFSRYFTDMNCTGEVSLQQHENVTLKQFRHIKSCD